MKKTKNAGTMKVGKVAEKTKGIPEEWFYMNKEDITVTDIKNVLEEEGLSVEIWKELGVVEVELGNEFSLDFVTIEPDLRDEYSNQFLLEHQVKTLFSVTLRSEAFPIAEKWMKILAKRQGGFFCGDTDDFLPIVQ